MPHCPLICENLLLLAESWYIAAAPSRSQAQDLEAYVADGGLLRRVRKLAAQC